VSRLLTYVNIHERTYRGESKGELLERYEDEKEKIDDDNVTGSDFIRVSP
jgi:hypothetical protein